MSQTLYRRDLAELHNTYYSGYARNAAPSVILMLHAAGVRSGVVCDLGCGGGQLTGHLLKAGFKAVGLDVSPSMIRIARKQYPRARFIRGSIDRAALPKCAAAVAVGEVVNYLGSRGRMQRAFRNVFRSLRPGGVFLFDVTEPARHAHPPEQLLVLIAVKMKFIVSPFTRPAMSPAGFAPLDSTCAFTRATESSCSREAGRFCWPASLERNVCRA